MRELNMQLSPGDVCRARFLWQLSQERNIMMMTVRMRMTTMMMMMMRTTMMMTTLPKHAGRPEPRTTPHHSGAQGLRADPNPEPHHTKGGTRGGGRRGTNHWGGGGAADRTRRIMSVVVVHRAFPLHPNGIPSQGEGGEPGV